MFGASKIKPRKNGPIKFACFPAQTNTIRAYLILNEEGTCILDCGRINNNNNNNNNNLCFFDRAYL
jgi:hypothetical protein